MRILLVSLVLLAVPGLASAEEKKPEEKKAAQKKAAEKKPAAKKSAAKSDKNVFQKAESAVGDAAQRSKIWTKSESRGQAAK
jgi:topoisomerase IA-like protein